jgi:hypothetical protein
MERILNQGGKTLQDGREKGGKKPSGSYPENDSFISSLSDSFVKYMGLLNVDTWSNLSLV